VTIFIISGGWGGFAGDEADPCFKGPGAVRAGVRPGSAVSRALDLRFGGLGFESGIGKCPYYLRHTDNRFDGVSIMLPAVLILIKDD
jgi:hypothetical protein